MTTPVLHLSEFFSSSSAQPVLVGEDERRIDINAVLSNMLQQHTPSQEETQESTPYTAPTPQVEEAPSCTLKSPEPELLATDMALQYAKEALLRQHTEREEQLSTDLHVHMGRLTQITVSSQKIEADLMRLVQELESLRTEAKELEGIIQEKENTLENTKVTLAHKLHVLESLFAA